jgi:phytoene dehydrogenase-like protein
LVLDRVVFSPEDLERNDPNLVGGDNVAGSHHLRQNALFRSLPGWSTYRTPLDGLYMAGAATWPGGGSTGLRDILRHRRFCIHMSCRAR